MEKTLNLKTSIANIELSNPLMPASGPLVGDYDKIMYLVDMGIGGAVTKTISTKAAEVPRPCIIGGKDWIMNNELWSELPPEEWINNILPKLKENLNVPLIVSAGYTVEDMEYLIPKLDKFADAFEISTHYVGKDINFIAKIVKAIRKNTEKPIFMKMSPHIPDPIAFAKMAKENGANGIVAVNSLGPVMNIDLNTRSNKIGSSSGFAWVSGPVIKNLSLALVNTIRENVDDITIIGVGGIKNSDDVLEYILAGADAVQMLSSALLYGKQLYKKIVEDLPKSLQKYGFESIEDVKNHRLTKKKVSMVPNLPEVDMDKCTLCKLCEKICPYWAITIDSRVHFDPEKCFGCGLCESKCPTHAISGVL